MHDKTFARRPGRGVGRSPRASRCQTGSSGGGKTLIILLSAPAQTMTGRLAARTGNPYGKASSDMDRILSDLAAIEPLWRKAADHHHHPPADW